VTEPASRNGIDLRMLPALNAERGRTGNGRRRPLGGGLRARLRVAEGTVEQDLVAAIVAGAGRRLGVDGNQIGAAIGTDQLHRRQ